MKPYFFRSILFISLGLLSFAVFGQAHPGKTKTAPRKFTISKADLRKLLTAGEQTVIKSRNTTIDKAQLVFVSRGGDMIAMKYKLSSFPNAFLMIQVNGENPKQLFVTSEDDSVFYTGEEKKGKVIMRKCTKDEIVSE